MFQTNIEEIVNCVKNINPVQYGKNRNYIGGDVTRLSPYISRGVLSTKFVMQSIFERNLPIKKTEKLIQELAWRDYFQNVWRAKKDLLDTDLKQPQPEVKNYSISKAILHANTGIEAIDKAIKENDELIAIFVKSIETSRNKISK